MIFISRSKAPDRVVLLNKEQNQRSEFRRKHDGNSKLVKRFSAVFRPRNGTRRVRTPDADEATPPSSPTGPDEPLTISMISSPYPHPLEEDNSYSGTTISDLSASFRRPIAQTRGLYSPPIMEQEEERPEPVSAKSSDMQPNGGVCHSACSEGVLSKMLGLVDRTCGSAVTTTDYPRAEENRFTGPSWGTAPSGVDDDDDDTVIPSTLASGRDTTGVNDSFSLMNDTRTSNAEFGNPEVAEEAKEATKMASQEDAPAADVTTGAHENFELVLDPSVLKKDMTKRSLHKWRRIRDTIIRHAQSEKNRETADASVSIASVRTDLRDAASAPAADQAKSTSVDVDGRASGNPSAGRPKHVALPNLVQKITMRKKPKEAKELELAAALMKDGELVGEEYLEEYEDTTLQSVCTSVSHNGSASHADVTPLQRKETTALIFNTALKPIDFSNRTTSWNDLTNALATFQSGNRQDVGGGTINRSNSSPIRLLSDNSKPTKAAPPNIWRSAVDPNSGRLYYYHRITRKSTWSKPKNFDERVPIEKEQKFGSSVRKASGKISEFEVRSRSAIPLNVIAVSEPSAKTLAGFDDRDIPVGSNGQPLLKKTNPRDFQNDVWEKKKEITKLLTKMAPPDDASVVKLMAQYEGREDELLVQLGELVKSHPFDEPGELPADDLVNVSASVSEKSLDSINLRTRTANTTTTSKTEKTDRIKNTAKKIPSTFESIQETTDQVLSDLADDSLSSQNSSSESAKQKCRAQPSVRVQRALASKQRNSGRTRELHVEEFSTKRWGLATVNYEGKATPKLKEPRSPAKNAHLDNLEPETFAPPNTLTYVESSDAESNYLGDNDETDVETYTDTVSALSVPDPDFSVRMEEFDRARRRALDDAIRRKDWDLAASVTENIRNRSMDSSEIGTAHYEWTQSELDQFISENDWDAVASYIALMRDGKRKAASTSLHSTSGRQVEKSVSFDANIQKRFGARSQLQRVLTEEEQSCSSWESESFYESESESSSSMSDDFGKGMIRKEFAC